MSVQVEIATDLQRFFAQADLVICAASLASPSLLLGQIAPHALVCDAGYPKNLSPRAELLGAKVFFGGLGQTTDGLRLAPDFHGILNRHPFLDVVHGCLLEGMALALEGPVRTLLSGKRVHHSGAGRGDGDNCCTAWGLSRTALQRRWTSGGRTSLPDGMVERMSAWAKDQVELPNLVLR